MRQRLIVNLPEDVNHWIETEARREDRTKTAVITRIVRAQMMAQREQDRSEVR